MSETVDPVAVPRRTLLTGAEMPAIGFGTFGSDHADHDVVAGAVRGAVEVGYRHIDCASVYGNEAEIGASRSSEILAGGHRPRGAVDHLQALERQARRRATSSPPAGSPWPTWASSTSTST